VSRPGTAIDRPVSQASTRSRSIIAAAAAPLTTRARLGATTSTGSDKTAARADPAAQVPARSFSAGTASKATARRVQPPRAAASKTPAASSIKPVAQPRPGAQAHGKMSAPQRATNSTVTRFSATNPARSGVGISRPAPHVSEDSIFTLDPEGNNDIDFLFHV
jgi:hypothetical protein